MHDRFGTTAAPPKRKKDKGASVLTLTIISHPNPMRMGDLFYLHGNQLQLSRLHPDFTSPTEMYGSPLDDPYLSRNPILLESQGANLNIRPNGKTEVLVSGELLKKERQLPSAEIDKGVVLTLGDRIVLFLHRGLPAPQTGPDHGLIGHSLAIRFLRAEINRVADLSSPILLRGLSGTGKELVAGAIHRAGSKSGPFVSVNMGAISPGLAASELFGAVKGSFTGSDRNQLGYFRSAQDGTLFLDEVGETSPEVQVMLLRALETGEVSPVGAQKAMPFKTRFLAATDADLGKKMAEDSFKAPLFHRLAGYEIRLPALSERLEDFGRLFLFFAKSALAEVGEPQRLHPTDPYADPWIPAHLMTKLLSSSWPGNVRQLRNVVHQLVIGCRGEPCLKLVPNVAEIISQDPPSTSTQKTQANSKRRTPASISNEEVATAMRDQNWDINAASEILGISRGALYLLIKKNPDLRTASDLQPETIREVLEQQSGNLEATARTLTVSARALRRRCNDLGISVH